MRSGCKWEWMPWRLKPQPEWHSVLDWKSGSVSWQLKSPVESGGGLWNQSWFGWNFGVLQTWTMWMKSLGEFWSAKMRSGVIEEFWRI